MVLQVIACTLASAGLLTIVWCLAGAFLLPVAGAGLTVVYRGKADAPELEQTVRSIGWLRRAGVVDMPLEIYDCGLEPEALALAEKLAESHSYIQIIRRPAP